jgi:hypothetical protein
MKRYGAILQEFESGVRDTRVLDVAFQGVRDCAASVGAALLCPEVRVRIEPYMIHACRSISIHTTMRLQDVFRFTPAPNHPPTHLDICLVISTN